MICRNWSLKDVIALVCIIQCLMNPVSYSSECVHCIADEHGKCFMPSERYAVDCEYLLMKMNNEIKSLMPTIPKKHLNGTGEEENNPYVKLYGMQGQSSAKMKFLCQTARGTTQGEKFVFKTCAWLVNDCNLKKLGMAGQGFFIDSCETCDYDLCNSASNSYIKLSYVLVTVAIIYNAVY